MDGPDKGRFTGKDPAGIVRKAYLAERPVHVTTRSYDIDPTTEESGWLLNAGPRQER